MLEARFRALTTEQRDVFRARIVLLAAEGRSTRSIARTVGTMPRKSATGVAVSRARAWRVWRTGRARAGAEIWFRDDSPHPSVLEREPPAGFARWNGPLIAAELGDVHEQHVWRVLRAQRSTWPGASPGAKATTRFVGEGRRRGRPLHGDRP